MKNTAAPPLMKKPKPAQKFRRTRAQIAAELGLGERTLQRKISTERERLFHGLLMNACEAVLLCERAEKLAPLLASPTEAEVIRMCGELANASAQKVAALIREQRPHLLQEGTAS